MAKLKREGRFLLSTSMKAPLSAFGLVITFTGISMSYYPNLLIALSISYLIQKRLLQQKGSI